MRGIAVVLALVVACNAPRSRGSAEDRESRSSRSARAGKVRASATELASSSSGRKGSAPVVTAKPPPAPRPLPPPTLPPPPPLPPPPASLAAPPPPPLLPPVPSSDERAKERLWVTQIALRSEFAEVGKSRVGVVARWTAPIRLSVMQGDSAVRADLLALIPKLNETLEPAGAPIRVVEDGDGSATLKVYYARSDALPGIARANGFEYVAGNDGYFHTFWNDAFHIQRAFVLLATDKLRGRSLRHFTCEEVTQSLGLANDSSLFADSIFYGNGSEQDTMEKLPTELSPRDKKLLSFLYSHLQPGDDATKLGRAFDAHW